MQAQDSISTGSKCDKKCDVLWGNVMCCEEMWIMQAHHCRKSSVSACDAQRGNMSHASTSFWPNSPILVRKCESCKHISVGCDALWGNVSDASTSLRATLLSICWAHHKLINNCEEMWVMQAYHCRISSVSKYDALWGNVSDASTSLCSTLLSICWAYHELPNTCEEMWVMQAAHHCGISSVSKCDALWGNVCNASTILCARLLTNYWAHQKLPNTFEEMWVMQAHLWERVLHIWLHRRDQPFELVAFPSKGSVTPVYSRRVFLIKKIKKINHRRSIMLRSCASCVLLPVLRPGCVSTDYEPWIPSTALCYDWKHFGPAIFLWRRLIRYATLAFG